MASRRTRIKGIANIPQRKRNVPVQENDNPTNTHEDEETTKQLGLGLAIPDSGSQLANDVPSCNPLQPKELNSNTSDRRAGDSVVVDEHKLFQNVNILNKNSDKVLVKSVENQSVIQNDGSLKLSVLGEPVLPQKTSIKRRTFIKPEVSAAARNKKPKISDKNKELAESIKDGNKSESGLGDTFESTLENGSGEKSFSNTVTTVSHELTLDEVHLTAQIRSEQELPQDKDVKRILPIINHAPNSDTEYPPPPPSPSKISRSRIKAIPRLGYRKTSFSASESEDESKRNYNRNRNDSVCSTTSGVPESIADCMSPQRPRELNSIAQKKCNRTEQSRKLAEARREFQRRFGSNKPDKQKLTMIDLIFYNPASNPMTNEIKSKSDIAEEIQEIDTKQSDTENEKVDDPQPQEENVEEAGKSDEENEMPVPQIKIGPSGEIVLDEKSLVVENKEVKKQREELQKTKVVDGDFDTGYGIYKRQKRAKEWTRNETLRFYKALNIIGTDFTLMVELFPKRTRRELKLKFKKEEKINRALIDKAVMQPCNFNYAELKHEVDMEERELEELQRQRDEEKKLKQDRMEERQLKKRKAMEKIQMEQDTQKSASLSLPSEPMSKIKKAKKPRQRKFNIESVLEDSDADVSDIATQSESEDELEIVGPLKPTRSGRIPKITKKYDTMEECSIENIIKKSRVTDDTNSNNIEPGSIMIITENGSNGEPVHKIYMVTADKNATPLKLDSDVVSKAIQFKKGITAQNILTISASVTDDEEENLPIPEENNVTIAADENITTLRNDSSNWDRNDSSENENNILASVSNASA